MESVFGILVTTAKKELLLLNHVKITFHSRKKNNQKVKKPNPLKADSKATDYIMFRLMTYKHSNASNVTHRHSMQMFDCQSFIFQAKIIKQHSFDKNDTPSEIRNPNHIKTMIVQAKRKERWKKTNKSFYAHHKNKRAKKQYQTI